MTRSLHRVLRRLLPQDFRDAHGPDMEEVFVAAHAAARRRGVGALIVLWMRELIDLTVTGRRLRSEVRRYGAEFVTTGVGRRRTAKRGGMTLGLMDDLRYAIRSLIRRPSLAIFAVLTIALGIGATTAMFSTVESVVLNPLPYENGDRMVGLFERIGNSDSFIPPSPEHVSAWAAQTDIFEAVEPWTTRSMTLSGRGEPREVDAALIRPSFHDVIRWDPLVGRAFDASETAGDGSRVLLLSYGFAQRMFGGAPEALRETLTLNGEVWTVVGVMPRGALMPGWGLRAVDMWRPFTDVDERASRPALGVLRIGVSVDHANERLLALAEAPDGLEGAGYATLVAEQVSDGIRGYLGLLMGAVVLLLLIACVNVSNLLLFRAHSRKRETAVRSALGGGRGRLARQLLMESLLLASVGGAVGIAISYAGQVAIIALRPDQLEVLDFVSINARVLAFALSITLAAGLVFGLLPAIQAGRSGTLDPLRSGARSEGDVVGRRLRWMLVSGEVALSFALLIGSLTVLATLVERQRVEMGYAVDEIVIMSVRAPSWRYETPEARAPLYDRLLDGLSRLPGIARVTRASGAPPRAGVLFGTVEVEGQEPSEDTKVLHGPRVLDDYFVTLGQPMIEGRGFTAEEVAGDAHVMVFGETTARTFFPGRDAVGARFRMGGGESDWITVVGVVADVPMTGLSAASRPLQIYRPLTSAYGSASFIVRIEGGTDASATIALMREVAQSIDSELRVDRIAEGRTLQRETLESERFATTIMAVFATFALLLAALGLYGVVSQVVGQRTREIGIRMALGARQASIASMVLRRAGGATLVGIVGGVVLAVGGTRLLESRIVEVEASAWGTFALAALALGLTALLAAYAPARRATRVDPVAAMRTE